MLVPCTDGAVWSLSQQRDQLVDQFRLPLGDHDGVDLLMDKVRFADHAKMHGLAVPRTEVMRSRADAEKAAEVLAWPSVLKPPVKAEAWLAHTSAKGIPVQGPEELLEVYDRVADWAPVLLAQEWVEGPRTSCSRATPTSTPPARRWSRSWHASCGSGRPQIGTSASGEECRNDEVLEETLRVFGSVDYQGLAYLEMKRDSRTGAMSIIEPNVGRPTGRSAIAEGGGVELVYTAYCDAAGLPLPEARTQQYLGTTWLDVRRDIQAAAVGIRRGELTPREWLSSLRGPRTHAIWSARDPRPFVTDLTNVAKTAARRGR